MKEGRSINLNYLFQSLLSSLLILFLLGTLLYTTFSYKVISKEENFTIYEATFMVPECVNPSFDYVEKLVPYLQEQLSRYPIELQDTHYQFVFCESIDLETSSDGVIKGVYFPTKDANSARIWLLIEPGFLERYREKYFFTTLHHEIFHYIDYHYLNDSWDYTYYGDEELPMDKRNEYVNEYAATSSGEDRAVTFSMMMLSEYFYLNQFKTKVPFEKAQLLYQELGELFPHWEIEFTK